MKRQSSSLCIRVLNAALVTSLMLGTLPHPVAYAEGNVDETDEIISVEAVEDEEDVTIAEDIQEEISPVDNPVEGNEESVAAPESVPSSEDEVPVEVEPDPETTPDEAPAEVEATPDEAPAEVIPQSEESTSATSVDAANRSMSDVFTFKNGKIDYGYEAPSMPYAKGNPVVFKDPSSVLDLRYKDHYNNSTLEWVYVKLVYGTDYTVRYENNTTVGQAYLVAVGRGRYSGQLRVPFQIYASGGSWYRVSGKWRYDAGSKIYEYQGKKYSYPRNGFFMIDSKTYLFNASGDMLVGWQKWGKTEWDDLYGRHFSRDNWYYLSSSGALVTGWKRLGGKWYYLDPRDGGMMTVGEAYITDGIYYFNDSGAMQTGWVKIIDTNNVQVPTERWSYFHSNGKGAEGWTRISKKWYFFSGGSMCTGWIQPQGTYSWSGTDKYYLDPKSGAMVTGWKRIDGSWYHFAGSGKMSTGWVKSGSAWYYTDTEGKMLTGWVTVGGKRYYLKPSGVMATGWQKINGRWYYFYSGGSMARSTWIQKWYYVDSSGRMMESGVTPDGYRIVNGKWDGKGKVA